MLNNCFLVEFHPIMIDDNINLTCYNNEDILEKLKRARQGSLS